MSVNNTYCIAVSKPSSLLLLNLFTSVHTGLMSYINKVKMYSSLAEHDLISCEYHPADKRVLCLQPDF